MTAAEATYVWVTKYLFTMGILRCRVMYVEQNMVTVPWSGGLNGRAHFHGADWQRSLEEAKARAKVMIAAKRRSISKTQRKLAALEASLENYQAKDQG